MADDERPAVGTVAEEAARLLDALGGWATSAQAGYAAGPGHAATAPGADRSGADAPASDRSGSDESGSDESGSDGSGSDRSGTDGSGTDEPGTHAGGADSTTSRCSSCGAENGVGQAVACQLCPVCQGIGLLRSVRPETVDRLADLAGALAATLRDIAGQRRADPGSSGSASPRRSQPHSSRVQDITVDDEDAPGSATS
ncbi:hypothetical protein [Phycicoccus sp. Soil802]|uniref:hypothetical protein n=1 Tax=Phycicoccus sp. Soil802 TaxID=1736414 RepID=UPI0007032702|nr:hypothetical protein [Phycicoccus sp. Soil802]KRF29634.1 hypothetical protein ASG91_01025 [Phycicoccus sp. Soil802]